MMGWPSAAAGPCAACKILRRRCSGGCVLAPYFPPTEPLKFAAVRRVFGVGNIAKLLQGVPEECRADATASMAYEASMRARDPVYGSAGAVCRLQRQVVDLQAELARAKAKLLAMRLRAGGDLELSSTEVVLLRRYDDDDECSCDVNGGDRLDRGRQVAAWESLWM